MTVSKLYYQVISFEAQPEFANERTMVPVRAISEALGNTVKYTELDGLKTVQLINGNITIELYIGKTGIKRVEKGKADIALTTDVSPYVKSNLTYVPVRFFTNKLVWMFSGIKLPKRRLFVNPSYFITFQEAPDRQVAVQVLFCAKMGKYRKYSQ